MPEGQRLRRVREPDAGYAAVGNGRGRRMAFFGWHAVSFVKMPNDNPRYGFAPSTAARRVYGCSAACMQGEWRPIPQVNKDTGIPALTTPEFLTKRSYSWILCAMANFYGTLTVQQAFRIIEQQNPGLTTQDEVSAVLHREEDDAASATSAWKARSTR